MRNCPYCFPNWLYHVTFPLNSIQGFQFSILAISFALCFPYILQLFCSSFLYCCFLLCLVDCKNISIPFSFHFVYIPFFKKNELIYFKRERERVRERSCSNGRGEEIEGERESHAGSSLSVQNPTWSLIPWIMRSWPEPKDI